MAEKIVCIDGHSIMNRAFYGLPELTNSAGIHTNAVYGFMNILLKILAEEKPDYLLVAFDRHEPTFRHKMFGDYKGTRKAMPEELKEQIPIIKELLTACRVPIMEIAGFEADDILGSVSRRAEEKGMEVTLVSGDRDLLQLATDHTRIRIPKTRGGQTITENYYAADVLEKYQVSPVQFIDVKALMGDSSDNIPGVPSIGEKTATNLIVTWGSLANIKDHLDEVKPPRAKKNLTEFWDQAEMSRTLAEICLSVPLELDFEAARLTDLRTREAYELLAKLELKKLMARFEPEMAASSEEKKVLDIVDIRTPEELGSAMAALAGEQALGMRAVYSEVTNPFEGDDGQISLFAADGSGLFDKEEETKTKKKGSRKKAEPILALEGLFLAKAGGEVAFHIHLDQLGEEALSQALSHLSEEVPVISVLDLKAELKRFRQIPENGRFFDAGVASYLLNPLKSTYDIDDIARDVLSETLPHTEDLDAARVLAEAAKPLQEKLSETGMDKLYAEIELPLIYSLDRMEKAGIMVRKEALASYGSSLMEGINALEERIYEAAGHPFNINSPKQLGEVLFDEMKLPYAKKTKTGYSTNVDVLEKLKPMVPMCGDILEYRTLTKLKSTYADGLAVFIGSDDRIHGKFNQTVTATGRISSADPNLQNIPVRMELGRELRKVFVPAPGCLFVDADYSQIELRILAHMSGDEKLVEAYRENKDIHRITASQVFGVPFDEVSADLRRKAKAVNFGIVYGISSFGLGEDLGISRKEAGEYIERYFETYPGIKNYLDGLVKQGKEQGFVSTMFGRRRPVPELAEKNFMRRQFGERVAMNSPIQGTAADIMKIAMIRVDKALRDQGLKARIVLQVHDELLIETPEKELEAVKELLVREMEGAAELKVPLIASVSTGKTWYETK